MTNLSISMDKNGKEKCENLYEKRYNRLFNKKRLIFTNVCAIVNDKK